MTRVCIPGSVGDQFLAKAIRQIHEFSTSVTGLILWDRIDLDVAQHLIDNPRYLGYGLTQFIGYGFRCGAYCQCAQLTRTRLAEPMSANRAIALTSAIIANVKWADYPVELVKCLTSAMKTREGCIRHSLTNFLASGCNFCQNLSVSGAELL